MGGGPTANGTNKKIKTTLITAGLDLVGPGDYVLRPKTTTFVSPHLDQGLLRYALSSLCVNGTSL